MGIHSKRKKFCSLHYSTIILLQNKGNHYIIFHKKNTVDPPKAYYPSNLQRLLHSASCCFHGAPCIASILHNKTYCLHITNKIKHLDGTHLHSTRKDQASMHKQIQTV